MQTRRLRIPPCLPKQERKQDLNGPCTPEMTSDMVTPECYPHDWRMFAYRSVAVLRQTCSSINRFYGWMSGTFKKAFSGCHQSVNLIHLRATSQHFLAPWRSRRWRSAREPWSHTFRRAPRPLQKGLSSWFSSFLHDNLVEKENRKLETHQFCVVSFSHSILIVGTSLLHLCSSATLCQCWLRCLISPQTISSSKLNGNIEELF